MLRFAVSAVLWATLAPHRANAQETPVVDTSAATSESPLFCYGSPIEPCTFTRSLSLTKRRNILSIDLGATILGRAHMDYERAVSRRLSVYASLYVVLFDSLFNNDLVGYGLAFGTRVFMVGAAPEGFWIASDLGTIYRRIRGNANISIGGVELTTALGYTAIWKAFSLSFGLGGSMFYGRLNVIHPDGVSFFGDVVDGVEFGVRVRSAFGVAF